MFQIVVTDVKDGIQVKVLDILEIRRGGGRTLKRSNPCCNERACLS